MSKTVLITGSNRGVGLALTSRFFDRGDTVLATCRDPSSADELNALAQRDPARVIVLRLDVDDDRSVAEVAAGLTSPESGQVARRVRGIDALVNNAARGPMDEEGSVKTLDLDGTLATLRTNSVSPLRVARAFLPLLAKGSAPRIVNITSGAGDISAKKDSALYAYGASKAALNFVTRALAAELKAAGIIVAAVGPGWVRTRMGGSGATLSPAESAAGLAATIDGLTMDDTGQWFTYDGRPHETW